MLRCVFGERNSGKSMFVEEQVKKEDKNALYIATLPELEMYQDCIDRHRMRRPASWECLELFQMPADKILDYPYQRYRNIILDNLSYFILFRKYWGIQEFIQNPDRRITALIRELAASRDSMVHIIDTPLSEELLEGENEAGVIIRLFSGIIENCGIIERYYSGNRTVSMTAEEGKAYLFRRMNCRAK